MPWAAIIPAVATIAGGLISANGTRGAQNSANDAAAKAQQDQLAQQMALYLMQRGINPGTIAGLGGAAGSSLNTVLPLGATVGGVPAEQLIMQALFGQSGLTATTPDVYASEQNINAFFAAHPEVLQEINDARAGSDDPRTPAQWLRDHVTQTEAAVGGGTFTNHLKNFATSQVTGAGTASTTTPPATTTTTTAGGTTATTTPPPNITSAPATGVIPPEITALNNAAIASLNKVYNGGFLADEQSAMDDIARARLDAAAVLQQRNDEQRGGLKSIYDTGLGGLDNVLTARNSAADSILKTQLGGLDEVLGNRRTAANNILNTELSGLANLRGVGETGARSIYGAELGVADTYENAVKQAVSRSMEANKAARALRGFSGDSSGDALMRARTLAGGYQQAGGARAQASVNLENLLNQYRTSEASGQLSARSKGATSFGDASIQDALARLSANTGNAQTRGAAGEMDALGRATLGTDYSKGLAGILDSDVARATNQANLLNAGDRAQLVGGDISRQLGSLNAGTGMYSGVLNLSSQASNAKYNDINALLSSLGFFRQQQPNVPQVQQVQTNPTLNSGQIAGSALSQVGQGLGNYLNNQSLINALNQRSGTTRSAVDDFL